MIYYELSDAILTMPESKFNGKKYWVSNSMYYVTVNGALLLMQCSARVWQETISGVRYIKNRKNGTGTAVDLTEFFWIKLQANQV
jgi:hypothetical protein